MGLIKGFRVAQIQLGDLQVMLVVKSGNFVQHLDIHPFIRLQTNGQLILRQLLPGLFEQVQFRRLEVNHDFGTLGRQTFTGTQVERYARPAPVVDIHADRHEGFCMAGLVGPLFLEVARHFFALGKTGGVLAAHRFFTHVGAVNAAQRFQHLHFFIADAIGSQI